MATLNSFEELEIWKIARGINKDIFKHIKISGKDPILHKQINRSAGSIMDNIAEGFERNGTREFVQFLSIAKASCAELRSQLYRALDRDYINQETFTRLSQKTILENNKIGGLIRYLKRSGHSGTKFKEINKPRPKSRNSKH